MPLYMVQNEGPTEPFPGPGQNPCGTERKHRAEGRRLGFYFWLLTVSSEGSHWNSKLGSLPIRERDHDWVDLFNWVNFEGQMKALSLNGS